MGLIQCADGHLAPAVMTCRHIVRGAARVWMRFPLQSGEETSDCLCDECFRRGVDRLTPAHVRLLCLHCFRELAARNKDRIVQATAAECVRYGFWEEAAQ